MAHRTVLFCAFTVCLCAAPLAAKPIAFARGSTVMVEYGADTMKEVQAYHAPKYWWSAGGGWLELDSEDGELDRRITYLRGNLLAKRWNLPNAQANVFVWGGVGSATGNDFAGHATTFNAGFQVDAETRRLYAALRSDLHTSDEFTHRIDALQLGFAPYEHDYDGLATWFVLQGRHYTGGIYDGVETALLLRFFKGGTWIEIGGTPHGEWQAMVMFNF